MLMIKSFPAPFLRNTANGGKIIETIISTILLSIISSPQRLIFPRLKFAIIYHLFLFQNTLNALEDVYITIGRVRNGQDS